MAYKVFSNGNTLPASDLNTYLMNQSVMTFATAAARSSAITSPSLGMLSWRDDGAVYEYYNGTSWVSIAGVTTGQVAGKNKIINGAFDFWQRGTSFSNPNIFSYTADRWQTIINGSPTFSVSQQAFTPGSAPVTGYESSYFLRQNVTAVSSTTVIAVGQRIEDVRTFAGQTVTLSFWAKADTARTWSASLIQGFGSGGSADVTTSISSSLSVTTSWQRFTITATVPSISGKTIGAGSYLYVVIYGPGTVIQTMDIWGVQLEVGSSATPFSRAAGTLQGELAACHRYYYRVSAQTTGSVLGLGHSRNTTTDVVGLVQLPVEMRIAPTAVEYSTIQVNDGATGTAATSVALNGATNKTIVQLDIAVASGLQTYRPYDIRANSSASAYLGFTAEL